MYYEGRQRAALRAVTERIEPGAAVAITGPSGCGKTTLCRVLAGFIPSLVTAAVDGDARLDGLSVLAADPATLAARLGFVQQDPEAQICTLRVRQEVGFGPQNLCLPRGEVEQRVDAAMEAAGIAGLADRDTPTLSGGEKQRVAIASILAMNPGVLVLDEPTANLDPRGAKQLFDTLRGLQRERGRTLLVVEHRLVPLLSLAPCVWRMDAGEVVAHASPRSACEVEALGGRTRHREPTERPGPGRVVASLEDVWVDYGERPVLHGLSLQLRRGEILGVIGPNGGGKTTLLRAIAGLTSPRAGRVWRAPGARVGMVFQHPHQQIFERDVRRELEIDGVLGAEDLAVLLRDARLVGLVDAAPLSLSQGEKRRLTLATTLRCSPDVLLLDEPFIAQDRRNVEWVVERLRQARHGGAAVALVTHDVPEAADLCDRILYLGEETFLGRAEDVFSELSGAGNEPFTPGYWGTVR